VKDLSDRGLGRIVCNPVVHARSTQRAAISILGQVSYLKDWRVEEVGGSRIADPEVGILHEGIEIELTPIVDPDGGAVVLSGSIRFSSLVRPIRESRLEILGTGVSVQLPEIRSYVWNGEATLDPGQDALMVSGLRAAEAGGGGTEAVEVWCLVTVAEGSRQPPVGEIVGRDDRFGNLFVKWPADVVPDDPWSKAPKEVTVYRKGEPLGPATLAGGWVLGGEQAGDFSVIAIYRLPEGTGRDGDSVR
jgi:hypothetical protein